MIPILLPAYGEGSCIGTLLSKIEGVMETYGLDYRVVVVNDGSDDDTLPVLQKFADQMPVGVLNHCLNRGLWETVRDGFEWAADDCKPDDIILPMDADDTHEPKYIPAMVTKINQSYAVVIAVRFQAGGSP